jgi:calpain-5
LDVQEVDDLQFVRLRNPWGRKEWTGDWSDNSPLWTRRLKAKLNFVNADDGAFWMSFSDFSMHFDDVYICRFFSSSPSSTSAPRWIVHQPILSRWDSNNAGGCTNFPTVNRSPQYFLKIDRPTMIVMNLGQADTRGTANKLKAISIEIYSNKGRRILRTRCGPLVASNSESYCYRKDVTLETTLQPAAEAYTVLVSTFNPNEFTDFVLNIYSTEKIEFKEAPSEDAN